MEWKSVSETNGAVAIPRRWLYIHYYEALNILFRTENALRVFVYIVLKCALHDRWTDAAIQVEESRQSTIASLAARRIAQARGHGYLGFEIASPLMHLNSGELTRLMMSDAYWPLFEPHFKGKREIIRAKLEEISTVRNALAHFRPIKHEDIELIKQNVRHVFLGIEEMFNQVLNTNDVVPTNTTTAWYQTLTELQTPLTSLILVQSPNTKWLTLQLIFRAPVLTDRQGAGSYHPLKVLKLNTDAVVRLYPNLRKHCVFVTEEINASLAEHLEAIEFRKRVSILFARDAIEAHYDEVKADLGAVQSKIEEEVELLSRDHLARGALIDSARCIARKDKTENWWKTSISELESPFNSDDPPEYWANAIEPFLSDFIAGTAKYPWMPVDVSNGEEALW